MRNNGRLDYVNAFTDSTETDKRPDPDHQGRRQRPSVDGGCGNPILINRPDLINSLTASCPRHRDLLVRIKEQNQCGHSMPLLLGVQ